MNRNDLFKAMNGIDNNKIEKSENTKKKIKFKPWWIASTAAVIAVGIIGGIAVNSLKLSEHLISVPKADKFMISAAEYPKMVQAPTERELMNDDDGTKYDKWRASLDSQQRDGAYTEGLQDFYEKSMAEFLSSDGENKVYSPINLYMALSMLAEITDGESRQQILDLLGKDNIEDLRRQASDMWNDHYRDDGRTKLVLGNSIWMDDNLSYKKEVLDILSNDYYASSFSGEMGSEDYNKAYRKWLNEQTDGLLKDAVNNSKLDKDTILALASTICFKAKWANEFQPSETKPQTFHGADGDSEADFMHRSDTNTYFWGENFSAVCDSLQNTRSYHMWFILPDEDVNVNDLLKDEEVLSLIFRKTDSGYFTDEEWSQWKNSKSIMINYAIPKFDIHSETDLEKGLASLGVTDAFNPEKADFSPVCDGNINVTSAKQNARVAIDEEGVTAVAYTEMLCGAGAPPDDEVDFTLDRPFMFAIVDNHNMPLFTGVVNNIE